MKQEKKIKEVESTQNPFTKLELLNPQEFNVCTYVHELSLEETNCKLSQMDTHSPELNCTATFLLFQPEKTSL